jgi:hypothetical protein
MKIRENPPYLVSVYTRVNNTLPLEYPTKDPDELIQEMFDAEKLYDNDPLTSFDVSLKDKYPVIVLDFANNALAWMKLQSQTNQFLIIEACRVQVRRGRNYFKDRGHCYGAINAWGQTFDGMMKKEVLPAMAVVAAGMENIVYFPKVAVNQIRITPLIIEPIHTPDVLKDQTMRILSPGATTSHSISLSDVKLGFYSPSMMSAVLSRDQSTQEVLNKNYTDAVAYCRRHGMELDITTPYQAFRATEPIYNDPSYIIRMVWSSIQRISTQTNEYYNDRGVQFKYSSQYWLDNKFDASNKCTAFFKLPDNQGPEEGPFIYILNDVDCADEQPFACKIEREDVQIWSLHQKNYYDAIDDCARRGLALGSCSQSDYLETGFLENPPHYVKSSSDHHIWGCWGQLFADNVVSTADDNTLYTEIAETEGGPKCSLMDLDKDKDTGLISHLPTWADCSSSKHYTCTPLNHGAECYTKATIVSAIVPHTSLETDYNYLRSVLTDGNIRTCYTPNPFSSGAPQFSDWLTVAVASEFQFYAGLDYVQMVRIYTKEEQFRLRASWCDLDLNCVQMKFPEETVANDWTIFYVGGVYATYVNISTESRSFLPHICEVEVIAFNEQELPYQYIGPRPMNYEDATAFCIQHGLQLGGTAVGKYSVMKVFKTAGKYWDTFWSPYNRVGMPNAGSDGRKWPWKSWLSEQKISIEMKYTSFFWHDDNFSTSRLCAAYYRDADGKVFVLSDKSCEEKHNFVCGGKVETVESEF